MPLVNLPPIAVASDRRAFTNWVRCDGFRLSCLALREQIWIFGCHGFTMHRGDEAVICYHENQRQ
jgi:hypothetical protein